MNLTFDNNELTTLQDIFNTLDPEEAIFMNHYSLSKATGVTADRWKLFMLDPQVSKWMSQELQLFKEFQLKQMIKDATDDKRSVGAAQMINSLTKALQEGHTKEGPTIIYTHVPLTEAQEKGTPVEVRKMTTNILAAIPVDWKEPL